MSEMRDLVRQFTGNTNFEEVNTSIIGSFSLENGFGQLQEYFTEIQMVQYEDSLEVTGADDFVNYVVSCNGLNPNICVLEENQIGEFRKYIRDTMSSKGKIHISRKSGTFIARKA